MTLIFWVEPFFEVGLLYHVEYDFASKLFSLYWVIDRISNSNMQTMHTNISCLGLIYCIDQEAISVLSQLTQLQSSEYNDVQPHVTCLTGLCISICSV